MKSRRTFLMALSAVAAAPWVPMPAIRPKPWPLRLWPDHWLSTSWLKTVYPKAMLDRLLPNMVFDRFTQSATLLGQNAATHLDQVVLEAFIVSRMPAGGPGPSANDVLAYMDELEGEFAE
jgi:hypothetical protein